MTTVSSNCMEAARSPALPRRRRFRAASRRRPRHRPSRRRAARLPSCRAAHRRGRPLYGAPSCPYAKTPPLMRPPPVSAASRNVQLPTRHPDAHAVAGVALDVDPTPAQPVPTRRVAIPPVSIRISGKPSPPFHPVLPFEFGRAHPWRARFRSECRSSDRAFILRGKRLRRDRLPETPSAPSRAVSVITVTAVIRSGRRAAPAFPLPPDALGAAA